MISVELEGIALICMDPISVSVCQASGANHADNLSVKTLMNVQTRVSVLTNSVRILLDPMSAYPANLDTKHREECVTMSMSVRSVVFVRTAFVRTWQDRIDVCAMRASCLRLTAKAAETSMSVRITVCVLTVNALTLRDHSTASVTLVTSPH